MTRPAEMTRPTEPAILPGPHLMAEGLVRYYGKFKVVDGVSLSVEPGQVVGLLGPNGAGKTTTFYMIVGLLKPKAGTIRIGDTDITQMPMYRRARLGVGYLPQEPSVFRKLSVKDNIQAILETIPMSKGDRSARLDELLAELDMTRLADRKAWNLSGGERRRLEITRALATRPSFLLLDEPFVGIDPIAVAEIQEIVLRLKAKGLGILITDHNVRETLSSTDHAFIMFQGRIMLSGTADQLAADPEARRLYLGEKFQL
ncbi:MAG TPA: LPS export ABC transporter ATP-binding protein [Candidatus Eisenbacteria bacterium]